MRVRSRARSGNAVCWNGRNVDEVKAVAGEHFVSLHSEYVLVEHSSGEVVWVRQGWWITREDGAGEIHVFSAGAFADTMEIVNDNAVSG